MIESGKMKSVCLLLSSVVFLRLASSSSQSPECFERPSLNLEFYLRWMEAFAGSYQPNKHAYEEFIRNFRAAYKIEDYGDIEVSVSAFITQIADLRKRLVKVPGNLVIDSGDVRSMITQMLDIAILIDEKFEGLKAMFSEWEQPREAVAPSTKITDPVPLSWFRRNGFDERLLHSMTIHELKQKIENMTGNGGPLTNVLGFFSKAFFMEMPNKLGNQLAWLTIYGGSKDATKILGTYLKSFGRPSQFIALELLRDLRKLGESIGPLRKLIGTGASDGLYTQHMKLEKYTSFSEKHAIYYYVILTKVCETVEEKLRTMRNAMRYGFNPALKRLLDREGILAQSCAVEKIDVAGDIDRLIGEHGYVTNVCNSVKAINYALGGS